MARLIKRSAELAHVHTSKEQQRIVFDAMREKTIATARRGACYSQKQAVPRVFSCARTGAGDRGRHRVPAVVCVVRTRACVCSSPTPSLPHDGMRCYLGVAVPRGSLSPPTALSSCFFMRVCCVECLGVARNTRCARLYSSDNGGSA